mmetsp:Transcript_24189/g.78066  ORF Transcript_24189/g.78066 Transcript_24189/m.78066 type:complete len:497 (-) Transcript_24189:98-1588(-)|eukprot:scaffold22834_cov119-Isochrysis_galbana.AAC.6
MSSKAADVTACPGIGPSSSEKSEDSDSYSSKSPQRGVFSVGLPSALTSCRLPSVLLALQCERRGGVFRPPNEAVRFFCPDNTLAGAAAVPAGAFAGSLARGGSTGASVAAEAAAAALALATSAGMAPFGAVAEREALLLLLLDAKALEKEAARAKLPRPLPRELFSGARSESVPPGGVGGGEGGGANEFPNGCSAFGDMSTAAESGSTRGWTMSTQGKANPSVPGSFGLVSSGCWWERPDVSAMARPASAARLALAAGLSAPAMTGGVGAPKALLTALSALPKEWLRRIELVTAVLWAWMSRGDTGMRGEASELPPLISSGAWTGRSCDGPSWLLGTPLSRARSPSSPLSPADPRARRGFLPIKAVGPRIAGPWLRASSAAGNCGDMVQWQAEHSTTILLVAATFVMTSREAHCVQVKVNDCGRYTTGRGSASEAPLRVPRNPLGARACTASMPEGGFAMLRADPSRVLKPMSWSTHLTCTAAGKSLAGEDGHCRA